MRPLSPCLFLALACAPTAPDEVERANAAIVGGTVDDADSDVYVLSISKGTDIRFCSGTLIAPRTLLTAAHCLAGLNAPTIGVLNDTTPDSFVPRLLTTRIHPAYDPVTHVNDLALVLLHAPSAAAPRAFDAALPPPLAGEPVRAVGYGRSLTTPGTDVVRRRSATLKVNAVTPTVITTGDERASICDGDSGGPLFYRYPDGVERVVAVHSSGSQFCNGGSSSRVDLARDFIATWLTDMNEAEPCTFDGRCSATCASDPDCACRADGSCSAACPHPWADADCSRACLADGACASGACGTPDFDCEGFSIPCTAPADCPSGVCTTDPQHEAAYCSARCDGDRCPQGYVCSNGTCTFPPLPTAEPGNPCQRDRDFCGSGFVCTSVASGTAPTCQKRCAAARDCTVGTSCEVGDQGERYCRPPPSGGCSAAPGAAWLWALLLPAASFFHPRRPRASSSSASSRIGCSLVRVRE